MNKFWLAGLQPHEVWRGLSTRSIEMRAKMAELLCYIAEADARQLYRDQACDSMYACCVRVLLMSEDAACRRIDAARVARSHPRIFPALEDGRLNVSAILLLKPHLTTSNADELISAAEGKSYRAIKEYLACRFPQADLPTVLRPIGGSGGQAAPIAEPHAQAASFASVSAAPIADGLGHTPAPSSEGGAPAESELQTLSAAPRIPMTTAEQPAASSTHSSPFPEPRPRVAPLSAERYGLQVTISKNAHDLLRRAQDLLAHAMPASDVGAVLERALTELVAKLEHAKFAQTDRPARRRSSDETRHIPAEIKRQVHARDGGRCTFESDDGRRCGSQRRLEYDHIQPLAKGGRTTVENVRLLCAKHNQLEAERRLGAGFMAERRAGGRRRSVGTAKVATTAPRPAPAPTP